MDFDTKIEDFDLDGLLETEEKNDNQEEQEEEHIENQEEQEEKEGQEEENQEENELSDDELLFNEFASNLYKKGILNSYENIKSEDDLYEAFQESIKQNEYKDLTDRQKLVLEAFREGIPEEDIISNQRDIEEFSNISMEDIENKSSLRENILTRFYLLKGMEESEAKELASVINDSNSAIEKTTDALKKLKEYADNYIENQKIEKEKELQKQIEEFQNTINNIELKIKAIDKIDNIKISDGVRNRAFETITKSVGVDEYGNQYNKIAKDRMEDPIGFEARAAIFYELTNGFRDFKNISKTIQTKEATKLSDILRKKGTSKSNNNEDFSFLDKI